MKTGAENYYDPVIQGNFPVSFNFFIFKIIVLILKSGLLE